METVFLTIESDEFVDVFAIQLDAVGVYTTHIGRMERESADAFYGEVGGHTAPLACPDCDLQFPIKFFLDAPILNLMRACTKYDIARKYEGGDALPPFWIPPS